VSVGEGLLAIDRMPNIHDLLRVVTLGVRVELEQHRIIGDQQRDGAGPLCRLAGRAGAVSRDVGGDDERLSARRAT
jgi:hypothetical protein